jgi:hypothetical protein
VTGNGTSVLDPNAGGILANAIEQRGFFWWFNEHTRHANSKQSSVPGMLTVTQTGQTTLELDGALAEDQEHADWSKPRSFGSLRIVGLLDTPGDYVLLEGLERTDFSIADEGWASATKAALRISTLHRPQ